MKTNAMYVLARIEQLSNHLHNVSELMGNAVESSNFISDFEKRLINRDYHGGSSDRPSYHLKLAKRLTKWAIREILKTSMAYKQDTANRRAKYDYEVAKIRMENPKDPSPVFSFEGSHYGTCTFPWAAYSDLFKISPQSAIDQAKSKC